jgi:hypothetical protein
MSERNRWGIAIATCVALMCLSPLTSFAQRDLANRRSYSVVDRYQQAISHVTLTADQKPAVAQIMANASSQADQFAATARGSTFAERAQALGDFARSIRQQLAQVLTADQMATLDLYLSPGPSSRPTADDFAGPSLMRYLPRALNKVDLTADQRQQVNQLIQTYRQNLAGLRAQTANGSKVFVQVEQLRENLKSQIASVLSSDQMQSLIQAMANLRESGSGPATRPEAGTSDSAAPEETGENSGEDSDHPSPDVGAAVPSLKIPELNDENSFDTAKYRGHVLVLEFGSMSCPQFRDQVSAMESLRSEEGPRAFFLLVYTREAHPAGGDELQTNKDQNISIAQTTTLAGRRLQAQRTAEVLGITMAVAVDSMDDAVSNAFGAFPNGAVVIGKDGKIAAIQHWAAAEGLRQAIDDAYDAPAPLGN